MRLFISVFFIISLLSLSAFARTDYKMKLVYPFGEDGTHASSICDQAYRTLDGCCEPPHNVYTTSGKIGCCKTPNLPLTVGTNTRCCVPAQPNQSRWNQTEISPCGQFCTQPSFVLTSFGQSSCCTSCTGTRWSQTTGNICGSCCSGTSSVLNVGAYSSCCASCSGERWAQSTTSVCGNCCPTNMSVITYQTAKSCCSLCPTGQNYASQTTTNVCGICKCPDGQYADGNNICKPCPTNCLSCTNGTTCDKCDPRYPIFDDLLCVACPVCP